MNKLKVNADIKRNRLHLHLSGIVTKEKMERLYTEVRFCVADLQPGFDAISDYTTCTLLHLSSIPALKKIMSYLLENGLREIVRVLNEEQQVAYRQMLNMASHIQGYKPLYVTTVEEAEDKLETLARRESVRVVLHNISAECSFEDRKEQGQILDMSLGGCAVEMNSEDMLPKLEEEVLLQVRFGGKNDKGEKVELASRVVRVGETSFAVRFNLDDEKREVLWKFLLEEARS